MNEQKTSRLLTFEKLWLISERELSAREVTFSPGKNLLTGGNGTGKSRVVKHCFWALGCEIHKRVWGPWDSNAAAAIFFKFDGQSYTAVRRGDRYGLLDRNGVFIVATGQYKRFQEALCDLLGYELTLKRPNTNKFSLAGIPYLAVPFYLDQDGGWGTSWNTFDKLSQFEKWINPVFEMFIGLSPNAYLVAKVKRQEVKARMDEILKQLSLQQKAFEEVSKALNDDATPALDPMRFKSELRSLATSVASVQREQRDIQEKVTKLASEVARLESDLAITRNAQAAVIGDLVYLTELPTNKAHVCPTCGWEHSASIHAKLNLGTDADALGELVGDLTDQLTKARTKYATLKGQLFNVEERLRQLDKQSDEHNNSKRIELKALIATYSRNTVSSALASIEAKANEKLRPLESEWNTQNQLVKQFEDKGRRKSVKKTYLDFTTYFMSELQAPPEERVSAGLLGRRPPTGGSEMPRSVLAVHLAMLHTSYIFSDTPILPLVVDTFQHSDQDAINLPGMINAAYKAALPGQQTIFAAVSVPDEVNLEGVDVKRYTEKRKFLRKEDYEKLAPRFAQWLAHIDQAAQAELLGLDRAANNL